MRSAPRAAISAKVSSGSAGSTVSVRAGLSIGGIIRTSSDFRSAEVAAKRWSMFCSGSVKIEAKNNFAASAASGGDLYASKPSAAWIRLGMEKVESDIISAKVEMAGPAASPAAMALREPFSHLFARSNLEICSDFISKTCWNSSGP
jgi:hypothetical protein